MKLTRQNLSNIAIALVAVLLFAGFVFLATKGDGDNNDLSAVAPTTTTRETTTTSAKPTTTTSTTLLVVPPTTAPASTATTRKTTATTAKPKATTTTAHGACAHGQQTELSDNKNTFTYDATGWTSGSSSTQDNSSTFPLGFTISTERGAENRVKFVVSLTNNTACTATFGDNLVVAMTLHPPSGGGDTTFTISPPAGQEVRDIKAGETITLRQERALSGSGTFEATGACDINYG